MEKCYSLIGQEQMHTDFDQLIVDMLDAFDISQEEGDTLKLIGKGYHVADSVPMAPSDLIDAACILDTICEAAYEIDELVGDCYMDNVSAEAKEELNELVWAWMERQDKASNYFVVSNLKTATITKEDLE